MIGLSTSYHICILFKIILCFVCTKKKSDPRSLGVTTNWLANGFDHSQTAAGEVAAVCGCLNDKRINILSILLLESPLYPKQAILLISELYKWISSHSEMLLQFANGHQWSQLRPFKF